MRYMPSNNASTIKYIKAMQAYEERNYEVVIQVLEEYLENKGEEKNGIDAKGLFVLAKSYQALKMTADSIEIYEIILELDSNNTHARVELGKLYAKQGKEDKAERLFQECLEIDSENVYARIELGKLYVGQGKEEEAEKLFGECIKIDEDDIYAYVEFGKLCAKQGREREAEENFQKAKQKAKQKGKRKSDPYALLELGKLYVRQGKEKEAEELFQECIDLDSEDKYALLELGRLYVIQGKTEEAKRLLEKCKRIDPQNEYVLLELGRLYESQGETAKAEELFQKCKNFNSNDICAILQLEQLHAEQKREKMIYQYILDRLEKEIFNGDNRRKNILKHKKDDRTQKLYAVFSKDPLDLLTELEGKINYKKKSGSMCNIYVVESKGCGWEGGYKGDGHTLDYITLIVLPEKHKIITMFPSDNILELENEQTTEVVPNVEGPHNDGNR